MAFCTRFTCRGVFFIATALMMPGGLQADPPENPEPAAPSVVTLIDDLGQPYEWSPPSGDAPEGNGCGGNGQPVCCSWCCPEGCIVFGDCYCPPYPCNCHCDPGYISVLGICTPADTCVLDPCGPNCNPECNPLCGGNPACNPACGGDPCVCDPCGPTCSPECNPACGGNPVCEPSCGGVDPECNTLCPQYNPCACAASSSCDPSCPDYNPCDSTCPNFDPCACPTDAGNCCVAHYDGPGCTNAGCQAQVCAIDLFCCTYVWDSICAAEANALCAVCATDFQCLCDPCGPTCNAVCNSTCPQYNACTCADDPCDPDCPGYDVCACAAAGSTSNCCITQFYPGCDNATCEAIVCAAYPYCCELHWDGFCASQAAQLCELCAPAPPECSGVSIVSANPPANNPFIAGQQPFRDVLQPGAAAALSQGIGASGTPGEDTVVYATISVTFSGTPSPAPAASNVNIGCTGGSSPSVTSVTGSGAGPYTIALSGAIPPLHCTTFTFAGTLAGQKLQYQFLPGDTDLNGSVNTVDMLWLVQRLNDGTANLPGNRARYNIDRSTGTNPVNTSDLLRLVQLLNGVNAAQAFNGATVAACP